MNQPEDGVRQELLKRELLELARTASRYLRRHASSAVRLATALLLAASLAACGSGASDPAVVESPAVAPLQQEISTGLPRGPGTYPIVPGSVFRDQRGVYQLEWLDPAAGAPTGAIGAAAGQVAHISRLRLLRDDQLSLDVTLGEDPVLHLPETENVGLIQEAQVGAPQAGPAYYPPVYGYWSPFTMGLLMGASRPAYYDPPRTIVVAQGPGAGGAIAGGAGTVPRVDGGTVSETARPPAQRVTGLRTAVSGRAGGTGAGNAVTGRNVGGAAASGAAAPSGAAGSAASRPGGASAGSGVTAPRSGGFSGGGGSSAGSASS